MVDLTHVKWRPNRYGGSEKKRTLLFDGKSIWLNFPNRHVLRKLLSAT